MTRDDLIQKGLEGNDSALAEYDQILWKIRTGYAAVLYGVFTLVHRRIGLLFFVQQVPGCSNQRRAGQTRSIAGFWSESR